MNISGEKAQLSVVRSWNRRLVLGMIRESKSISRYDISKATGLNPTTVAKLAQDLIDAGYILETGKGASSGGRKPVMLQIQPDRHHFFVHLVTDTAFSFSVLDFAFNRVSTVSVPFDAPLSPADYETILIRELGRCADCHFIGAAVGVVGTVDATTHEITHTPGIEGACNPEALLTDHLDCTVITQNLTRVQARCESTRLPEFDDLMYVVVDHGVGMGVILDGQLRTGRTGMAGEIGHTWIGASDYACILGHHGCLESHVGINAILDGVGKLIGRCLSIEELDPLAADNPAVRTFLQKKVTLLAEALSVSIDTIEPQVLVLAGDLMWESAFVFEQTQLRLRKTSFAHQEGAVHQVNLGRRLTAGQKEDHLALMLYDKFLADIDLMGSKASAGADETAAPIRLVGEKSA